MVSNKIILSMWFNPTIKTEDITIITDKRQHPTDAIKLSGIASFTNTESKNENITTLNTGNNTIWAYSDNGKYERLRNICIVTIKYTTRIITNIWNANNGEPFNLKAIQVAGNANK